MGYRAFESDLNRWGPRDGLEGPFNYLNGRVLYYDPKEGEYYDPLTDFYVDRDEVSMLQRSIFDTVRG